MTPNPGDKLGELPTTLATEMKVLENSRIIALTLLGTEISRFFWRIPCDIHHTLSEGYMKPASSNELNRFEISVEFCSKCELVSCKMLSAIVSAVTVIISHLLAGTSPLYDALNIRAKFMIDCHESYWCSDTTENHCQIKANVHL
ncbi:hypothetical protein AVEN_90748-1 [Araneus ventricosus]|uniref:Uncharacterized protein n=1 Tax=Araneus ventricosus TaxID=182803 RepID=A0A4Y2TPT9_ARAVE|nr:hypothetical protein AVEN_90748-1 [Araneus ventricosus]